MIDGTVLKNKQSVTMRMIYILSDLFILLLWKLSPLYHIDKVVSHVWWVAMMLWCYFMNNSFHFSSHFRYVWIQQRDLKHVCLGKSKSLWKFLELNFSIELVIYLLKFHVILHLIKIHVVYLLNKKALLCTWKFGRVSVNEYLLLLFIHPLKRGIVFS